MKTCSILVGLMRGLAALPDGGDAFGTFSKEVMLATFAIAPKYIVDERELRHSMAAYRSLTNREMAELAVEALGSGDLLEHPPHPLWILHHIVATGDYEAVGNDPIHLVSVITRFTGSRLSVFCYSGFEETSGRVGIGYPIWLSVAPDGIRVLNKDKRPDDCSPLIPPICLGLTLTLLALATPGTTVVPFAGTSLVIGGHLLDPATIHRVQYDAADAPIRH